MCIASYVHTYLHCTHTPFPPSLPSFFPPFLASLDPAFTPCSVRTLSSGAGARPHHTEGRLQECVHVMIALPRHPQSTYTHACRYMHMYAAVQCMVLRDAPCTRINCVVLYVSFSHLYCAVRIVRRRLHTPYMLHGKICDRGTVIAQHHTYIHGIYTHHAVSEPSSFDKFIHRSV